MALRQTPGHVSDGANARQSHRRMMSDKAKRFGSAAWVAVMRRYLAFIILANVAWEFLQMPLYMLWREGTGAEIAFAALHCSAGDALIAAASLFGALILYGQKEWPHKRYWRVAFLTLAIGLGYTIYSEWLNTDIRGSWAYTNVMPTLPWIGTGIAPLLQWIVVPLAGFCWARRRHPSRGWQR